MSKMDARAILDLNTLNLSQNFALLTFLKCQSSVSFKSWFFHPTASDNINFDSFKIILFPFFTVNRVQNATKTGWRKRWSKKCRERFFPIIFVFDEFYSRLENFRIFVCLLQNSPNEFHQMDPFLKCFSLT